MTLRPARPVTAEGLAFARFLETAADGVFRLLFGPSFDRIIAKAFLSPGHDMSYQTTVFAERDGDIAGMISGYTSSEHLRSSDKPLRRAAGLRIVRMFALMPLAQGLLEFIETVPAGDYYIQGVAVAEAHRGQGIGSLLLDRAEETARINGSNRIVLDVAEDNEHARRLYERRGMKVEAQSPPIVLTPSSSVYRMVKVL